MSTADPNDKWASAGRVQPDIEVAILDEDDLKVEKYKLRADAESRLQHVWDRERGGITVAR